VHERCFTITGFRLGQRVDHQACDELVATMRRRVPMGPVIAVLDHEIFLRQSLKHRHDRGVGQIAVSRKCLMDLAHRLGFALGPKVVHHRAFEFP
jgi:hypothetical protein